MSLLFAQMWQAFLRWWKQLWFESKLQARLKMIELENQIESEIEREEQAKPIYIEHPIDTVLQTGESRLLGGAMELKAPWSELSQKEKERRIDLAVSTSSAIETKWDKESPVESNES